MIAIYAKDITVMALDRTEKIKKLFALALEKSAIEQEVFLQQACDKDDSIYKEVLSLISSHKQAESFLEKPVANLAAKLIAENKLETPLTQLVGQTLEGKYHIEILLGQGGMGAVYKAIHLGTDRPVAIKVISPEFMNHPEFVERFKREAKAAGHLSHPNVVNVTDFGITTVQSNQIAYLVMEYLKGLTLGDLLVKKGKLPISFTIDIIEQVCSAIAEAHKQGIIHRDLKPDNIWLEPTGRGNYYVKVLDFGLAKFNTVTIDPVKKFSSVTNSNLESVENTPKVNINKAITKIEPITNNNDEELETKIFQQQNNLNNNQTLPTFAQKTQGNAKKFVLETQVGAILGTPVYMSPEQCQGKTLDIKSDIYSLGIITYQMLAGVPPFKCDSLHQYIHKHSEETPLTLKEKQPTIPKALSDLVMSTLEKDPSKRPVNAQAFAIALRTILEGDSSLLVESLDFYRNNFSKLLNLSLLIYTPFILLSSFIVTFLFQTNFNFILGKFIEPIWWLFPLLLIFIFGEINTAAMTLAVEQASYSNNKAILIKPIISRLKTVLPLLITTILNSYLMSLLQIWKLIIPAFTSYIEYSFCPSIIVFEKGQEIMKKSQQLAKSFYSLTLSLKLRSLLIKFGAFTLFCLVFFFNSNLAPNTEFSFITRLLTTIAATLVLPGLFLAISSPIIDVAIAKLYFKARGAQGESTTNKVDYQEQIEIAEQAKFSLSRKVFIAITLAISIVFSNIFYTLMVPPFGKPVELARPQIEKVADAENAWIEYDLAIQDVLDITNTGLLVSKSSVAKDSLPNIIETKTNNLQKNNPGFSNLDQVALGFAEFNKEQLAYLDKHSEAIKHLLAGAKRPKAQYYNEIPITGTDAPKFLQIRVLTNIACAQAYRLHLEGKNKEAVELALAAYRMATDIGTEKYNSVIGGLTTVVCRGLVSATLFNIINSGKTDAQTDLEIARQVVANQNRLPNTYQLIEWDTQAFAFTLEDVLVKQHFDKLETTGLGKYLEINGKNNFFRYIEFVLHNSPGLRLKTYNSYIQQKQELLATYKPILENWDFQAAEKLSRQAYEENQESTSVMLIQLLLNTDKTIASGFSSAAMPNATATMRSLYNLNTLSTALEIFSVCSAYKKTNGAFPANLAQAMEFAQLPLPTNLTHDKTIGYRLTNETPVIWFAGLDGKDDGGKDPYDRHMASSESVAGKDIIFEFGKIPFYFQPTDHR